MKRLLLLSFGLTFLSLGGAAAQSRAITGKITAEEDNAPLPGVNVLVKGTTTGTATNAAGEYRIECPPNGALVFSFIGFSSQEVPVSNQTVIDVKLSGDAQQLGEVVVTAIGIEREKKALGYAVTELGSEKLAQKSEADPIRTLAGKVPGVNIQGSGGAVGGNTNVTIRGNASLTGNVQPLFVVDGVPFDNSVNQLGDPASVGNQVTNRAFDLDPSNIASMTVLKGAAAAALYGSRAANGVIVITTKAGSKAAKKGLEVTYRSSYAVERVSGLPNYQNEYGSGQYQTLVSNFIGSFGPAFSEFDSVGHILDQPHVVGTAAAPGPLPEFRGKRMAYRAYPNNVKDFFDTGRLVENSIQLNGGNATAAFSGGFSRMDNRGILPNSGISRTGINLGGRAQLENGLFFNANVNYVKTEQRTPQIAPGIQGTNPSVLERLLFLPRMYDLSGLPFEDPLSHANVFYRTDTDNPYWLAKYAPYTSDVNRVFGKASVGYTFRDWLTVSYQIGFNAYTDRRNNTIQKGSADVPLGRVTLETWYREELDGTLLVTATRDLAPDLSVRAIVGHNANQRLTQQNGTEGNGIIVFGLNTLANTSQQRVVADRQFKQRYQGIFADVQFSYRDVYFLNLVSRNDWSSTLPKNNRSYFYPGVNSSVILNEALGLRLPWLNLAKLRAGYARVGNEALPYRTNTVLNTNVRYGSNGGTQFPITTGGLTYNGITVSDASGTPDLKPEFVTELELGTELKLLNNRVGVDFTWYDKTTTNAIAAINRPPSSGFTNTLRNLGTLNNRGVEVGLDLTPVSRANGFRWNVFTAFTRNRNVVKSIGEGIDQVVIGGREDANLFIVQRAGQPFGQILGTRMLRDEEGNVLISNIKTGGTIGRPLQDPNLAVIGNPNPNYLLGITNTWNFKGLSLSILIDYKDGGDMYSFTASQTLGRGVLADGNYDRGAAFVVPGVLADPATNQPVTGADGQKVRNTIAIANYDYWFTQSFGVTNLRDVHVFDASVVRLREVTLAYDFPKALLARTKFIGSAQLSLSGRNLWYRAPNFPGALNFDPETSSTSGSAQGLDLIGVPTTRRYGVNLSVTF